MSDEAEDRGEPAKYAGFRLLFHSYGGARDFMEQIPLILGAHHEFGAVAMQAAKQRLASLIDERYPAEIDHYRPAAKSRRRRSPTSFEFRYH